MLLKTLFWLAIFGYLAWNVYQYIKKIYQKASSKIPFFDKLFNNKTQITEETITKQFGDVEVSWKKKK